MIPNWRIIWQPMVSISKYEKHVSKTLIQKGKKTMEGNRWPPSHRTIWMDLQAARRPEWQRKFEPQRGFACHVHNVARNVEDLPSLANVSPPGPSFFMKGSVNSWFVQADLQARVKKMTMWKSVDKVEFFWVMDLEIYMRLSFAIY